MTDSVVSNASETRFRCPFNDEIVWPTYWKHHGAFRMRMLDAQQLNQICVNFTGSRACATTAQAGAFAAEAPAEAGASAADDAAAFAASAAAEPSVEEDAGADNKGARAKLRPRRRENPERAGDQKRTRKKQKVEIPEQKQEKQGRATLTGFLLCVYAYLSSIPVDHSESRLNQPKFINIFQEFSDKAGRKSGSGDMSRSQVKAAYLPTPEQEPNESRKSFLMRFAGYAVFLEYLHASFDSLAHAIDQKYDFTRHWNKRFSAALRSEAPSGEQHWHLDLDPRKGGPGISALGNISSWPYWVRIMANSAWNVGRFYSMIDNSRTEYNAFLNRFEITDSLQEPGRKLSAVMKGTIETKRSRAWQCYCRYLVLNDTEPQSGRDGYKKMQLLNAELEPLMFVVFDTRVIHGGGPVPGKAPRRHRRQLGAKRWIYRYGRVHFRYSFFQHWCICGLGGCLTCVFCHRCHHYFVPTYAVPRNPTVMEETLEGLGTDSQGGRSATLTNGQSALGPALKSEQYTYNLADFDALSCLVDHDE